MKNNETMQVILSTGIKFTNEEDVNAYKALSFEALPLEDLEFNEATKFIVGYEHIVLFGQNGRRLAVLKRQAYRGMAVDGKPITISGDGFRPVSTDGLELKALQEELEAAGWCYTGMTLLKKIREINQSGLRVHAVNNMTGEQLGDYDSMTDLIKAYPNGVFEPNDEPDVDENDWPVGVCVDD